MTRPAAASRRFGLSFEVFPAKTEAGRAKLQHMVKRLAPLAPDFVSVTCGAGGATGCRTPETVRTIGETTDLAAAAHVTCAGRSRAEIDAAVLAYRDAGVRRIVALRGDLPDGAGGVAGAYRPRADGYAYAADLIAGVKALGGFDISCAAYPETHPQAPDADFDLDVLKRKLDAGADRAITQYFFEAETFLRFRDRCAAAGIFKPIVPGILPPADFAQVRRFSAACGATVPDWLARLFEGLDDDPDTRRLVAATVSAELVHKLLAEGVEHLHLYTLNKCELTIELCRLIGVRPEVNLTALAKRDAARGAAPSRPTPAPARAPADA